MTTKDWILLLVPILCNGVIVFIIQKIFEKRQLILNVKYRYLEILQQKVDNALSLFVKSLQAENDLTKIDFFNQFAHSYCDVYYYYQQNMKLFEHFKNFMDELMNAHNLLKKCQEGLIDNENDTELNMQANTLIYKIYDLLQSIQKECIQHKI